MKTKNLITCGSTLRLLLTPTLLCPLAPLNAGILFQDDFSSPNDLTVNWNNKSSPNPHGVVLTTDPTYSHVLSFTAVDSAGTIFSKFTAPVGSYLTFDYKGTGGFIGVDPGGYLGNPTDWLAGQSGVAPQTLIYDSTWRQYTVEVPASGSIMMEIWNGYPGAIPPGNGPYSAEFANIEVSTVPEPTTAIAGAFMLLPVTVSVVRHLRKKYQVQL